MDGQADKLQPGAQTSEPELVWDADGSGFTDDVELATILRLWPTLPKAVRGQLATMAGATPPQALAGDTWASNRQG